MAKPKTVKLLTLEQGTRFRLPDSGREGVVLRTPSALSAYCRMFRLPDEQVEEEGKTKKKYDDITISSSADVVPLSTGASA